MEFTLFYQGKLKSNCRPNDKHRIRKIFHKQLKILWNQPPLKDFSDLANIDYSSDKFTLVKKIKDFHFVPRISGRMKSIAQLQITLLKPEEKGSIITNSGDIDNRLKCLLDALKIPHEPTALPKTVKPEADEVPFFCLLEDDNLITHLSVKTEQWLSDEIDASEVLVLIHVKTQLTKFGIGNIGFA